MPYERSQQIEKRFQQAIHLISNKSVNARQLAGILGISRPTIQRMITELKRRGYIIRSVRDDHGWKYELIGTPSPANQERRE